MVRRAKSEYSARNISNAYPDSYPLLYPSLQFTQHQLTDDVHAGIAVVKTRDRGKLLAAIVLEYLGVLLRDFFQRFQAICGKSGGHHGDAAHAVFRELR